ncbi:hypothetical protein ACLKA6_013335 [Drosophila palustris]
MVTKLKSFQNAEHVYRCRKPFKLEQTRFIEQTSLLMMLQLLPLFSNRNKVRNFKFKKSIDYILDDFVSSLGPYH